jgi:hypothetical protein
MVGELGARRRERGRGIQTSADLIARIFTCRSGAINPVVDCPVRKDRPPRVSRQHRLRNNPNSCSGTPTICRTEQENRRRCAFAILSMTSITSRSTRSRYSIRKDYSLYFFWSSSNSTQWAGSRSFILVASVLLNSSSFAVCKETRKAINSRCSFEGNRATSSFNCVKDITGRLASFYRRPKVFDVTPRVRRLQ